MQVHKPKAPTLRRVTLAAVLTLSSAHAAAQSVGAVQSVQPEQVLTGSQNGSNSVVLDVRTPDEFALGHVPGAVNVPLGDLTRRLSELAPHKNTEIVVYCEAGMRADHALGLMQQAGFGQLKAMDGHMRRWRKSGLPVEQ